MSFSYRGTSNRVFMALKTGVEPGGISKSGPSFRFMVLAWPMKKVES